MLNASYFFIKALLPFFLQVWQYNDYSLYDLSSHPTSCPDCVLFNEQHGDGPVLKRVQRLDEGLLVFLTFRCMHASVIIKFLYQTLQPVYKYTQANRVEYTMTCAEVKSK